MSMGEEDARLIASGIVQAFKFIASGEVGALPVRILRDPNEPVGPERDERDEARAALAVSKAECDTMARECAELSEQIGALNMELTCAKLDRNRREAERDDARAMVRRLADELEKLAELGQMTKHYRDLIAEARAMGGKAE